uniref:Uncharacterized protein n=1 Tax=Anguilla anguilla TaxID=7936 RepID=A0A0E9V885_ANGAN
MLFSKVKKVKSTAFVVVRAHSKSINNELKHISSIFSSNLVDLANVNNNVS